MSKQFVQNRYGPGDEVCAKVNPTLKLVVRRYIDQVYYCKIKDDPKRKELVYYERELVGPSQNTGEKIQKDHSI